MGSIRRVMVGVLVASAPAVVQAASTVVGFPQSAPDRFMAIRGQVQAGSVIQGVRFYSNDATVFPEVLLASEGSKCVLPKLGSTLRSVQDVSATAGGYTTVTFASPYTVPATGFYWVVVRFPDTGTATAEGAGGGPGLGWRSLSGLPGERSFFSLQGSMNEFTAAFDISLVMTGSGKALFASPPPGSETEPAAGDAAAPRETFLGQAVPSPANPGTTIAFGLAQASQVQLRIYDVAGHLVRNLVSASLGPGGHTAYWDGRTDEGASVSTGLYFVHLQAGGVMRTRKLVVLK